MATIDGLDETSPDLAGRSFLIDTGLEYYYRVTGITLKSRDAANKEQSGPVTLLRNLPGPGGGEADARMGQDEKVLVLNFDDLFIRLDITVQAGPCKPMSTNCPPVEDRPVIEAKFEGRFDIHIQVDESSKP